MASILRSGGTVDFVSKDSPMASEEERKEVRIAYYEKEIKDLRATHRKELQKLNDKFYEKKKRYLWIITAMAICILFLLFLIYR